MSEPQNIGSFIAENKSLVKEYLETRMEIYRLQSTRVAAKSAGLIAWIIIPEEGGDGNSIAESFVSKRRS